MRAVLAACMLGAAAAAPADVLRNWFDDPFFAVSSAVADCPRPAGPFVDERERAVQSHHRAERGTTCWLAGECERPNAYAYDRDIADAARRALDGRPELAATSLWITVQGRIVFVEGCAADAAAVAAVEQRLRALPRVQQVLLLVRIGAGARVPYRRFEP